MSEERGWGWARGVARRLSVTPPFPATGPVFVELPIDTMYPYFLVEKEVLPSKPPRGLVARGIYWYVGGGGRPLL